MSAAIAPAVSFSSVLQYSRGRGSKTSLWLPGIVTQSSVRNRYANTNSGNRGEEEGAELR